MIKILFVCHGNICRSTMAEYVMKDLTAKAGLSDSFHIDSAKKRASPAGITGRARCAGKSMTSLITSLEWIPGISGISTASSEMMTRIIRYTSFWILRTKRARISLIRGIRGILTIRTEM